MSNTRVSVLPRTDWIILSIYIVLTIAGLFYHEMWRDEYQAWCVAKDAHSIPELFTNLKYEGNPFLWHSLLYVISIFTHNVVSMQIIHIIISISFVFLLLKHSDFKLLLKIPIVFSYFLFYEYNVISRGYGLGVLFIFLVISLYKHRHEKFLLISLLLCLLSNTTIYGLIISSVFMMVFLMDEFSMFDIYRDFVSENKKKLNKPRKSSSTDEKIEQVKRKTKMFWPGIILFTLAASGSLLQIMPESNNTFPVEYPESFLDWDRFTFIFGKIADAYFLIPDFRSIEYWNFYLFDLASYTVSFLLVILIFLTGSFSFIPKPKVLFFFIAGNLILYGLYYYSGLLFSRYVGHVYILLIITQWLAHYEKDLKIRKKLLDKLSRWGKKIYPLLFYIIIGFHFVGGISAHLMDFQYPFSGSDACYKYIEKNNLQDLPAMGHVDFSMSFYPSRFNKDIYYPIKSGYGSFTIWDDTRSKEIGQPEMSQAFNTILGEAKQRALFIYTTPIYRIDQPGVIQTEGFLNENIKFSLLKSFTKSVVANEIYYLYLLEKTS